MTLNLHTLSIWIFGIFFLSAALAKDSRASFEHLVNIRSQQALEYLWKNVAPEGTPPGFIIASPSKSDPDYFYHWVRDAALVMRSLDRIEKPNAQRYLNQIFDYAQLESNHQKIFKLSDQGEPKFNADGSSFQGPWGRPQNDGPALRSAFFAQYSLKKLAQGDPSFLRKFYVPRLPARSLLKIDFEYISHQWHKPDFDLWEEIQGQHFYTRMVQAYALKMASQIAQRSLDEGARNWYDQQAKLIEESLLDHISHEKIILSTINRVGGLYTKKSLLDSSVILAVLHTDNIEGKVGLKSEEIMKTFMVLDQTFQKIYPINQQKRSYKLHMPLGNAIGRYPEDTFFGGNPWFLLTSTFAEFCYRQAQLSEQNNMHYQKFHAKTLQMLSRFLYLDGKFSSQFMANAWKLKGDQYLARVLHHMDDSGHQSEQIDKNSGELRGARDLTWSYAAFLTAVSYRQELLK